MSFNSKLCPFCREEIKAEAVKCRFCGEFLDNTQVHTQSGTFVGKDVTTGGDFVGRDKITINNDVVLEKLKQDEQYQTVLNWDRRVRLRGFSLSKKDLSRLDLTQADLSGADLSGANLYNVNLCNADLNEADLRMASLNGANLSGADLRWANLNGTDLRGANLTEAKLIGAYWREATIDDTTQLDINWRVLWRVVNAGREQALGGGNLTSRLSGKFLNKDMVDAHNASWERWRAIERVRDFAKIKSVFD